jgi:hypothetical protein
MSIPAAPIVDTHNLTNKAQFQAEPDTPSDEEKLSVREDSKEYSHQYAVSALSSESDLVEK